MSHPKRKSGLTRSELVAIVAMITLGFALLVPFIHQQKVQSQRNFCELRQIHTAFAVLHQASQAGQFPGYKNLRAIDADGRRQPTSWVFPALPYLFPSNVQIIFDAESGKYEVAGLDQIPAGPYTEVQMKYGPDASLQTRGTAPEIFIKELVCPADRPPGSARVLARTSFVVNTGQPDVLATDDIPADWLANGMFTDQFTATGPRAKSHSIDSLNDQDGSDYTLLLSENIDAGRWTDTDEAQVGFVWVAGFVDNEPAPGRAVHRINQQIGLGDGSIRFARPSSYHPGGVNAVFCSGRTTFLNDEIEYLVFAQMLSSDDSAVMLPGSNEFALEPYRVPARTKTADQSP